MLTPDFAKQEDLDRYEAFMAKLVELIVGKYDGSLKAEHGTGINMAPYVEREWGEKATELMWRVKRLADPDGVLAPGVVLNRDPGAHLRNLKTTPQIEDSASACVECGFCEPVCPSRNLTTTPRQRIVLRREMARQPAGSPLQRALLEEYEYDSLDTCAADGSCQLACPVGIDTGKLVKDLRGERHTERAESLALAAAKRWSAVEAASRAGLRVGRAARPSDRVAVAGLPGPAPAGLPETGREGAAAVYIPSCTNRIFGRGSAGMSLPEALVAVSARAGLPVWIPPEVAGTCCGLPWSSKGFGAAHRRKANETARAPLGLERGGGAAGRDRRRLLHPGGGDPGRRGPRRGERGAARGARDRRLGRLGARPPPARARGDPQGRLGHRPPDLRHPAHGPRSAPSRPRRRPRRRGLRRPLGDLLRLRRRPRHLPSRADRGGDAPTRPPSSPAAPSTPTSAATAPARSACSRATGAEYESFVFLLEELTRRSKG